MYTYKKSCLNIHIWWWLQTLLINEGSEKLNVFEANSKNKMKKIKLLQGPLKNNSLRLCANVKWVNEAFYFFYLELYFTVGKKKWNFLLFYWNANKKRRNHIYFYKLAKTQRYRKYNEFSPLKYNIKLSNLVLYFFNILLLFI